MNEDDVEIAIVVGKEGVRKTQIYAHKKHHDDGLRLYQRIEPLVDGINTLLHETYIRSS